ncbi:MAG: hypothetical protein R3C61_11005 [Bacteroidia bacterium]
MQQAALFYYFDDQAASFSCSDTNLNEVWNLCKYTLKATPFLGVYADGNRERMPYEADAYIQQLGHYTVDREYSIGKYTVNFLLDHASWPTEWQMHTILMAWEDYMQTGDADLLHNRYEDLKRKSLIDLAEPNGLISTLKGKRRRHFSPASNFPARWSSSGILSIGRKALNPGRRRPPMRVRNPEEKQTAMFITILIPS